MLGKSKRNVAVLAGAAGFNLLLGVAVASGVVPQMSSGTAASQDQVVAAIQAPAAAEDKVAAVAAEAAPVEETPLETTPPTTAAPETTTTTKPAAKAAAQAEISTPAPTAAPETTTTTAAPAQSLSVPRLNPASFSVFQAIQQLSLRIPLFKPSEAQARQFGDMVCSAFDQGKTYSEVRSAVLSAVGQVPGLSVSATDADFAIRTAVELFCPGHKSKLA